MENREGGRKKQFDWQKLYDGLLKPSDGHKGADGKLLSEYVAEELSNKVSILQTRGLVQEMSGESSVDEKIKKGLTILADGYPKEKETLKDILVNNNTLKKYADIFDEDE